MMSKLDSHKVQQLKHVIIKLLQCSQPDSTRMGVAIFSDPGSGRLDFFSVNATEQESFELMANLMAAKVSSDLLHEYEGPMQ
jgi:hypothetical protein